MGHACTHDDVPGPNRNEHPVVAVLAIIAIIAAMVIIGWVRVEVHGTEDIEAALSEPEAEELSAATKVTEAKPEEEREVEAAVTASRFATGFSQ